MGLNFKVFYHKRESSTRDAPGGNKEHMWVPTTSTLIYGERDAVLVDTQLTKDAITELLAWVIETGKNVTHIYITHAHGDHFFGNATILKQFPNAKVVSTPEIVAGMAAETAPARMDLIWHKLFPGQIPELLTGDATALEADEFEIEGEKLQVIRLDHTDTSDSTGLWVPSIGLLVAGDSVYNNVHPYLGEGGSHEKRAEWIAALDKLAALKPRVVIGGHSDPAKGHGPEAIEETKAYLECFNKYNDGSSSPEELFTKMLETYPARINPGSAWAGASASKNPQSIWALMAAKKK